MPLFRFDSAGELQTIEPDSEIRREENRRIKLWTRTSFSVIGLESLSEDQLCSTLPVVAVTRTGKRGTTLYFQDEKTCEDGRDVMLKIPFLNNWLLIEDSPLKQADPKPICWNTVDAFFCPNFANSNTLQKIFPTAYSTSVRTCAQYSVCSFKFGRTQDAVDAFYSARYQTVEQRPILVLFGRKPDPERDVENEMDPYFLDALKKAEELARYSEW